MNLALVEIVSHGFSIPFTFLADVNVGVRNMGSVAARIETRK